jgi:hypothetical protein
MEKEIRDMIEQLNEKLKSLEKDHAHHQYFSMPSADSPLGDIRDLIDKHGYGCFLETAKTTSAWHKIQPIQERRVISSNDMEVCAVYTALATLSPEEIAEWKAALV